MKIIGKNPLISMAAVMLMIALLTSAATFGVTHAWFVMTEPVELSGEMGKVDISIQDNKIMNDSNTGEYGIIVRVRVIVEENGSEIPAGLSNSEYFNLITGVDGLNWIKMQDADGGIFFVYGDVSKTGYDLYIPVADGQNLTLPTYNVVAGYTVSLIAEALQATKKAYDYTTQSSLPGATSWELK